MLEPIITLGGLGLLFGGLLAFAAKKLAVDTDPRVDQVRVCLPGANCGACGYGSCAQFAEALVKGEASLTACIPGGCEVSDQLADILGQARTEQGERLVAALLCMGDSSRARNRFDYDGVLDCKAAALFGGGPKACPFACIGLGTCSRVCPFDAIVMTEKGLPEIDGERCTGCGRCVKECPKKILALTVTKEVPRVLCSSTEKGREVRAHCDVGCIGCGICVKNCPEAAITMEDHLAVIDMKKCTNCGVCVEKCPRDCIVQGP